MHAQQAELPKLDPARITQIASWLAPQPATHFAPSFADRAFWCPWKDRPAGQAFINQANTFACQPTPELIEEDYDEFARSGQREKYEQAFGDRMARLRAFVFAEGLVNDGSRLSLIETTLVAVLNEPTWAVPAHAFGRKTWHDAYDNIDLAAAARAWDLATTDWLLGNRLKPEIRACIRKEVRARIFTPYLERVRAANRRDFWWMNSSNNWNAVCNSGIVGAALLLCETPIERAEFIAAREAYSPFFIAGFSDDGLCLEGMGYWIYGFGQHVLGAESIRIATGGNLDLLSSEKVERIAAFDLRWDVVNGIYPSFGDAWLTTKTAAWLHDFAVLRFGVGRLMGVDDPLQLHVLGSFIYRTLFDFTLPRDTATADKRRAAAPLPLRDWFPDGGALVMRPPNPGIGLAAALIGGHNDQPHNHNDLGSFVVINDGVLVLTDLGADSYVKDTFGPKRYTSDVMNSFGHPVPRVAGQLQKTGADAKAVTVRTEFTDARDTWEMDITSAYASPDLIKLTRTFIFTRDDGGKLEIIDQVQFKTPQSFGNAVILRPEQKRKPLEGNRFRVSSSGKSADIAYVADAGTLVIDESALKGIVPTNPSPGVRIGINFVDPVLEARLHTIITPSPVMHSTPV